MENRRRDYRCVFPPEKRRLVQLTAGSALGVEMLDLSLGGMRVRMLDNGPAPRPQTKCRVRFSTADDQPLDLDAEVVHNRPQPEQSCGLRFLRAAEISVREARERLLRRFLLEAQRRQRE